MKKNLLGLIGSLCGFATVFVYDFSLVGHGESISYRMLGMFTYHSSPESIFSVSVLATLGVFFSALYGLVQALDGIRNSKDNSLKIFASSGITVFSVMYYYYWIKRVVADSISQIKPGIGAILFIVLSIAFFVLSLLGFLVKLKIQKKNIPENEKINEIEKYKLLMDEGIITKEEFESHKNNILE